MWVGTKAFLLSRAEKGRRMHRSCALTRHCRWGFIGHLGHRWVRPRATHGNFPNIAGEVILRAFERVIAAAAGYRHSPRRIYRAP